jgi:hypothetical protein
VEFQCDDLEWRLVRAPTRPSQQLFHAVSWNRAVQPNCTQSQRSRNKDIFWSDVGGGIVGALFFGFAGAAAGGMTSSGIATGFHHKEVLDCTRLGTVPPVE